MLVLVCIHLSSSLCVFARSPLKAGTTPTPADLASLGPNVTLKKLNILREMFFQIAGRSKSVTCARFEPAMKKRMVTEIQARVTGAITLAIGDGANDVDMITAAHIGVGIAGVEGTAATNSADYAIGSFRMLHSLLFVHGFYSYQRTAKLGTEIEHAVGRERCHIRSSNLCARGVSFPVSFCLQSISFSTR
jgi:hypothetical protein